MAFDDSKSDETEGVCVTDWQKCFTPSTEDLFTHAPLKPGPWASKHAAKRHITRKHLVLAKKRSAAAAVAVESNPTTGTCSSVCPKK